MSCSWYQKQDEQFDFHTFAYLFIFWFYSFHTQTFAYPESSAERQEILLGLQSRIEDIKSVGVIHEHRTTVWNVDYLHNVDRLLD